MAYTVGTKGQVVIAKEIRDQLGIEPGSLAIQRVVDGRLVIHFVPPMHNRSLRGSLAKYARQDLSTDALLEAEERAWEDAVREEWERTEPDR
jgi:AbrB family looped-hinge helix DNA binding protein